MTERVDLERHDAPTKPWRSATTGSFDPHVGVAPIARVASELSEQGQAFKNPGAYEKTRGWLDQSLTWIIATRGMYPAKVVASWDMIDWPMNQARTGRLEAIGMEVGDAYNHLFRLATDQEFCERFYIPAYSQMIVGTRFVFVTEEDNIQPPNAVTGLMAAIYECPDCGELISDYEAWNCPNGHHGYDAVSGLYYTKSIPPRPMAYGNPKNGPDDFKPQPVEDAVAQKATIEVNGIGMGCAIFRKGLFAQVSEPWFQTTPADNATGGGSGTQDLFFCRKAKEEAGARFGVNCAVKVGHVNIRTGEQW